MKTLSCGWAAFMRMNSGLVDALCEGALARVNFGAGADARIQATSVNSRVRSGASHYRRPMGAYLADEATTQTRRVML